MRVEDQVWLGQTARAYYTNPKFPMGNLKHPTQFDQMMLSLFDSIESCADDVDTKIEGLRQYVRLQPLLRRLFITMLKIDMIRGHLVIALQKREHEFGKSDGLWQLTINSNRIARIAGSTWGSDFIISPEWIGPALPSGGR
jgi:hypothetical protein